MKKKLLNISKTIDPLFVEIYAILIVSAKKANVPFFVIGATARDLIFEHGYKIQTGRATRDIDIAIQVSTWKEYEKLKKFLLETKKVTQDRIYHRLIHNSSGIPIDIIPFGKIEDMQGAISWPPDYET